MTVRKFMTDKTNCKGCYHCKYYPYFHYTPSTDGFDIEYIKFSKNYSKVINHTLNITHIYNGESWELIGVKN